MATILLLVAALVQLSAAKVVYKYEGQAVIGMPESGRSFNVLRIEFNIAASKIGDSNDFVAKIDPTTVKVHNFTGDLYPTPEGVLPTDRMTPVFAAGSSFVSNLGAQLGKPIVVTRNENGTLSNIRHDTSDPYWSVNVKRGALSLLQINIQTDNGVYTVQEDDITGSCPSTYLVQSREHYHGHDHVTPTFLNVTKSRDYKKCGNRTVLRHSFFSGVGLSDEDFAEKQIISNAKFAYNISGTKASGAKLIIESATSEAQHIFSIFKPLSGSQTVYTHQRVTLLSQDSDLGELPSGLMSCTWAMFLPNVITAETSAKFKDEEVVGDVRDAVSKVVDPSVPSHMKGIYLTRIVERMRGASLTAWETIGQGALQMSQGHTKLLLDLAPSTGTLESLQKLQQVLDRVTPNITSQYFALASLLGNPTFKMITTMKAICDSPQVRETLRETKACALSMASMIHNRYFRNNYYLKNATFPAEEKAAVEEFSTLVDQYYNMAMTGNLSMQILWVKVAGNMGWPRLIEKLAAIAKNESFAIVLRVHALRAFRRMPSPFHGAISKIALPIFTDWHNDVEVRIAAYRAVMGASPKQDTLDLISAALHHEHDEHVRSYVYTHLMTLTNNPIVDNIKLSNKARVALHGLTSKIPTGFQYSHYCRLVDTYDDDRNAGFQIDLSVVGTTRSFIPREICVWARGVAFGVQANVFHFCLRLQGLQKALHKVFRKGGPVFPDFFSQLNLNQIEYEDYHGMWDASFEGSEIQYKEIPAILTQATSDPAQMQAFLTNLITTLRTPIMKTIVLDSTLQIPSLLGIPVQSNNTYITHINMSLGAFGFVPACRFNPRQPCQVTMKPYGIYRLGSQHVLGVNAGPIQSSVLLHGLVSRDRLTDRNWTISWMGNKQNSTITFDAELPKTRVVTGRTEVLPFLVTVDRTKASLADQYSLVEWRSWHEDMSQPYNLNFELNSTAKLTGFVLGFNKTAARCYRFPYVPAALADYPYCGKVTREFYAVPQENAPDRMQISIKHVGPPSAAVPAAASFRSEDSFAAEEDSHINGYAHDLMEDLTQMSSRLDSEMEALGEMRDHLSEMHDGEAADDEDDVAVESETQDSEAEDTFTQEEEDHFLVRRRRSANRWNRKDRKPGVSRDRKTKPEGDVDMLPAKEQVTAETSSITVEITGFRNNEVARKVEITSARTPTGSPKQYQRNFNIKVTVGGKAVATACGKATAQYPTGKITLGDVQEESHWSYHSKVEYGKDKCESDKTLEFLVNLSRSDEQKLVTRLWRSASPAMNKYWLLRMCKQDYDAGMAFTWKCRHLFNELNEAHRIELKLKSSDIHSLTVGSFDLRKWTAMLLLKIQTKYYKNLKSSFIRDVKKHSNEISIIGERNFQLPQLSNFVISTPETTSEFRSAKMPYHPMSLYFPTYMSVLYHMSGERLPGVCVTQKITDTKGYVSTFDNVIYNLTSPTCPSGVEFNVLLAADCSPGSKFAVSYNFQTTTKAWEIRVTTAAHTVKIRPLAKAAIPELYVDDVKVVDEKYEIQTADGSSGVIASNSFGTVSARLTVGVQVIYTPNRGLLIMAHPLYGGLTCGVCGDYNGQSIDEFTMADGTLTQDSNAFHRSYVAGIEQCTA